MKNKQPKTQLDTLLVLLLFVVFAVCVLSVLLMGANAYKRLAERDQASYAYRTAAQYLSTRVRQADAAGAVRVFDENGVQGLRIGQEIDGEDYVTYVYCWDGYLRELFASAALKLDPAFGEEILEAEALRAGWGETAGELQLGVTLAGGADIQLTLFLRSEGGVRP